MIPHLNSPASASISPFIILNKVVIAISLPTKAIFSSLFTLKLTLSKTLTPSIVLDNPSTTNMSLPTSLSGLNPTNGYLLLDGWISSKVILSNNFLRDVACLDLEALALNLAMKSCNSLIFSSFFLFWSLAIAVANWLDSYQKS